MKRTHSATPAEVITALLLLYFLWRCSDICCQRKLNKGKFIDWLGESILCKRLSLFFAMYIELSRAPRQCQRHLTIRPKKHNFFNAWNELSNFRESQRKGKLLSIWHINFGIIDSRGDSIDSGVYSKVSNLKKIKYAMLHHLSVNSN